MDALILAGADSDGTQQAACADTYPCTYTHFTPQRGDTTCVPMRVGCTDENASLGTLSPLANVVDDSLCYYEVLGCTDGAALNYDPSANVDDGKAEVLAARLDGAQELRAGRHDRPTREHGNR